MLRVSLLGEQYISGSRAQQVKYSSRSIALLAFLAVHADAPQARLHLAGIFWPDSTDAQARTNLRRELHHLRQLLDDEPSLVVEPDTLTWRDHSTCRVDLRVFAQERTAALQASDAETRLGHAESAVAEYAGDLLPGLYDDWVLEQRAHVRRQCVSLLDLLVQGFRDRGDPGRAAEFARQRLVVEPLEEVGYRVLMEVQASMGDRAGAISTFHQCSAVLERELGVEPSPETAVALQALLEPGHARPGTPVLGRVSARQRPSTPATAAFVGRDRELEQANAGWRRAREGSPGLLLVSGEPGVGKSRLAAEMAAVAQAEGAVVASTRCFGMARRLPLAPVADWLRNPVLARAVDGLAPVWRDEVSRLMPGVGDRPRVAPTRSRPADPALPPQESRPASRALADAWQRHRFYEGLCRAVLATDRPILLILDDLQWCDEETAAWLAFLLRLATDDLLLIVATVRSNELDDNPEIGRLLRSLDASGLATEIKLSPLDGGDVRRLGDALLGRALTDDQAVVLSNTTGGYPLYVVEALRDATLDMDAGAGTTPDDLTSVLRLRLDGATAEAREVAGLTAAYGREFTLDMVTEASDLDASAVVQAVDELWNRRIIRANGATYDFSHDLLREAAYESVTPARRWLFHRRIAQSLELLYVGREDEVAANLAEQYERGGRPARATDYYRRAAQLSAAVFANTESVGLFGKCLDLMDALPPGRAKEGEQLDVLLAMTAPLNAIHGYSSPTLITVLEQCRDLAKRLGRPSDLMASLAGLFAARFVQGRIRDSFDLAMASLALADSEPALAGQAHLAVAGSSTSLGLLLDASSHFETARELSDGTVSLITGVLIESHSLAWESHVHWLLGDEAAAVASTSAAVATAREASHPYSLSAALGYQATIHQLRGDRDGAATSCAELVEVCERYEFAWYVEWGRVITAWLQGGQAGIDGIERALTRLRTQGSHARMPYWLCLLAELHLDMGDRARARAVLDAARSTAEQNDELWWLPETMRRQAQLLDPEPAVALLRRAVGLATSQHSVTMQRRCGHDLAALEPAAAPRTPAG